MRHHRLHIAVILVAIFSSSARSQEIAWSRPEMDKTKVREIPFHGPFNNDMLTATRDGLGDHDFVEISFDLIIMASWDGSIPVPPNTQQPPELGPDLLRVSIAGGPTLVYSTFSNIPVADPGFREISKAQNFPSQIPGTRRPPQAGAKEFNTLGYIYPLPGPPQPIPMDARYAIKLVIPHHGDRVTLEFEGLNLQKPIDENWGVANLDIQPLADAKVRKSALDSIAVDFADSINGPDSDLFNDFQTLVLGMDDTVGWIQANVTPAPIDGKLVAEVMANLGSGQAHDELSATTILRSMGPQVEPYLRDARITANADRRKQIDWVLEAIGVTPISDKNVQRVILATRVLEVIGTPRALALRQKLISQ